MRELGQRAVAQQIGARVADVGHHAALVAERDGRDRRAHPRHRGTAAGDEADRLVAPRDALGERVLDASLQPALVDVHERVDQRPARDLARRRAADAVGDRRQPRAGEDGVLVVGPPADVACALCTRGSGPSRTGR